MSELKINLSVNLCSVCMYVFPQCKAMQRDIKFAETYDKLLDGTVQGGNVVWCRKFMKTLEDEVMG